jgi:hypothetical protein
MILETYGCQNVGEILFSINPLLDASSMGLHNPYFNYQTHVLEERITFVFREENQRRKKPACSRWFLVLLISALEDGGGEFLRIIGSNSDHNVLYPK